MRDASRRFQALRPLRQRSLRQRLGALCFGALTMIVCPSFAEAQQRDASLDAAPAADSEGSRACGGTSSLLAQAWPKRADGVDWRSLEGEEGYFDVRPGVGSPWLFIFRERDGQRRLRAIQIDFDASAPESRPEHVSVGYVASTMLVNRRAFRSVLRSAQPLGAASTGPAERGCVIIEMPESVRATTLILQFTGVSERGHGMRVGKIETLNDDEFEAARAAGAFVVQASSLRDAGSSAATAAGVLLVPEVDGDALGEDAVNALEGTRSDDIVPTED